MYVAAGIRSSVANIASPLIGSGVYRKGVPARTFEITELRCDASVEDFGYPYSNS